MTGRIVLIGSSEFDRKFAEQVAAALKFELQCYADLDQAEEYLDAGDLILFDAISQEACEEFEHVTKNFKSSSIHFITNSPTELCSGRHLIECPQVGSWLCRPQSPHDDDNKSFAPLYAKVLKACAEGTSALRLNEVANESLQLTESIQKEMAAQAVGNVCAANGCNSRVSDIIATSIDELIMNAIYNAPRDGGRKRYVSPEAQETIALTGNDAVEIQFSLFSPFIRISVTDLHGTFKRNVFLDHVARSFNGFQSQGLEQNRSSPGIGLAMIFRSGGNLFIDVDPNKETIVNVYFDIVNSFRRTRDAYRFIGCRFL